MLSRIEVRNFQSLHHVSLELSRFTVIVGQSSSGKSAFTRALRTLTSNARGTSFITHGELTCSIVAVAEDGTVALSKGKTDQYKVIPLEGEEKTYTKLGGDVPEVVSAMLGIPAKDPINYAGQFDMPYLLKSSPSEVARVLGELTNADIVFNAAKESNRRRLAAAATLRVKVEDLTDIERRAERYANLRMRLDALATAEASLAQAKDADQRLTLLDRLTSTHAEAIRRLAATQQAAEVELPTIDAAVASQARLDSLIGILRETADRAKAIREASALLDLESSEITRLEGEYIAALHAAGTCPTCGQNTKGVSHV
jgi:DNA repair ATPase RecN